MVRSQWTRRVPPSPVVHRCSQRSRSGSTKGGRTPDEGSFGFGTRGTGRSTCDGKVVGTPPNPPPTTDVTQTTDP